MSEMSFIPQDFERFIHTYKDNWQTIDIRIIAWKTEKGWLFHQIRIVLDSEPVTKPTSKDLPIIDNLLVIHERWDITELKQLLNSLETAELEIGGETIHIKNWNNEEWVPITNLSLRYHDTGSPFQKYGINYMSCSLEGYSNRQVNYNEKNVIDHRLRTYKHPWDGLEGLLRNFINLDKQWTSSNNSFLTIIAPVFLKIKEIQYEKNDVIINIEKSGMIKFDDILLSIISNYEGNEISRINQPITQNKTIVKLNKTPIKSKIMINYRNHVPDSKLIYGRSINQRLLIFQELYGDLEDFLEGDIERGGRKEGRIFETKVSLLFHLLGFSPAYYGYGAKAVPDILVFDNDNKHVMVVECTIRQPDSNNKLSKLATRASNLDQIIPEVEVMPVLMTALSRDDINKSDMEKAKIEFIAIISKDEVDSLFTKGLEQVSTADIFDYIQSLIPSEYSIPRL